MQYMNMHLKFWTARSRCFHFILWCFFLICLFVLLICLFVFLIKKTSEYWSVKICHLMVLTFILYKVECKLCCRCWVCFKLPNTWLVNDLGVKIYRKLKDIKEDCGLIQVRIHFMIWQGTSPTCVSSQRVLNKLTIVLGR